MGGGQSSSRNSNAQREQQARAAQQAREAQERRQREEAAAARARAEADRKRQEEEKRRRDEEEAARIKANAPFRKPTPPRLALTNKEAGNVNNMTITIAPGLSSSTVILSRDIIGKVSKTGTQTKPKEPMKAAAGRYAGTKWEPMYALNMIVPEDPNSTDFSLLPGNNIYISAFPDKDYPEVWVKGRLREGLNYSTYGNILTQQSVELKANQIKAEAALAAAVRGQASATEESVIMWNPSETKGQNGAVAINYKTHGALTKVFLKPTIPFEIGYDSVPLLRPNVPPPPAPK
jgi:hypothetical protein